MYLYFAKLVGHSRTILAESSLRRVAQSCLLLILNSRSFAPLLLAPRDSSLRRFVKSRPEIFSTLVTRYLAANWSVPTRVARMVDHCKTIESFAGTVDFPPDALVDLIQLEMVDPRYRVTLDQARWFLPEGQLVISLWDGVDRIFSIAFCLSSASKRRVAYVGAIQGRRDPGALEQYRIFAKAMAGMRARDFLIEVFKSFCRALQIEEIRAVSDANHSARLLEADDNQDAHIFYDEVWRERGGEYDGNGFFVLPMAPGRRMPSKKRAYYRKRFMMLDQIDAQLESRLRRSCNMSHYVGAEAQLPARTKKPSIVNRLPSELELLS